MTNKEFFIQTWQNEMRPTLSAINGLPSDLSALSFSCDAKARSATALISHMLGHAETMNNAADSFIIDERSAVRTFASKEEIAAYFEKNATALANKLTAVSDSTWEWQVVDFRYDGQSLYNYPMTNTFWMLLFDIIHHRGQLSTYYRHMGVRNPGIYGPTAEDVEAMMTAKN